MMNPRCRWVGEPQHAGHGPEIPGIALHLRLVCCACRAKHAAVSLVPAYCQMRTNYCKGGRSQEAPEKEEKVVVPWHRAQADALARP